MSVVLPFRDPHRRDRTGPGTAPVPGPRTAGPDTGQDTVPLAEVATAPGSPGRVLRMPAAEVRDRLVAATVDPRREFELIESLNQQQLRRRARLPRATDALDDVYDRVPA